MANDNLYGVVLNPVQDNARVVDAPASGGGGLATALSTLGQGVKSVSDAWDNRVQRKRQEAADRRAAQDQAWQAQDRQDKETEKLIGSDVALSTTRIDQGEPTVAKPPIELLPEISTAVGKIKMTAAAVDQGKLPSISREAQLQQSFNALVSKWGPQHAGTIAKAFREMGVGNALIDEITAEVDAEASNRKASVEFDQKMTEVAKSNIDPSVAAGMSDQDLINWGINYTRNDNELALLQKKASLQSTQNATDQSSYNFEKQVNADQYSVVVNAQAMTAIQPIAQKMQEVLIAMGEPGASPDLEARYSQLLALARTSANNIANSLIARGGYKNQEQADAFRKSITDYINTTLLSPYEQRNAGFASAVDVFNKRLGFSQSLSAPVIKDLRTKFGINPADIPEIMNSLPPAVLDGLKSELAGVGRPGVNENISTIHLTNILSVMKGEKNLNNIDTPQERAAVVASSWNFVRNNANAVAQGRGNADNWLNSTRQLVIASGGFSANTPTSNLAAASLAMFDTPTMNAVQKLRKQSDTSEEAVILSQGLRASAAVTLSAVQQQIRGEPITKMSPYRVGVNKDGKAVVYPNPAWKSISGPSAEATGFEPVGRPPIPQRLKTMVDVYNSATGFLARTAAWDDSSPKGTQREIRLFWATGRPTEDMKRKQATDKKVPSVRTMMDQLERELIQAPDLLEAPDPSVVSNIVGVEGHGKDPNSSAQAGFLSSTWLNIIKTNRPDLAQGKSDPEILAMRSNRALVKQAVGFYARDNAQTLAKSGIPATNGNLNLMHLFGEGDGPRVLAANPNTPIERLVSGKVLAANPWMRGKTVAEIRKARRAGA
jgi:hypothetical protein